MAALLAMGLNLNLAGWRPFATLRMILPGLDGLRSPFRFAVIAQLCLPILAAVALVRARQWLAGRSAGFLLVPLGLLAAGENLSVPAPLTPVPSSPRTTWSAWLRAQPENTVVAHVPFPAGLHVSDYEIEARRLLAQIDHHRPIINGYSGYFPQARGPDGLVIPTYTRFQLAMATEFPNYRLMCVLGKSLGANRLVANQDWLNGRRPKMDVHGDFLRPVYSDEQVQIYSLEVPEGKCQPGTW